MACIAGNEKLVRRLLDQGHPVNIRDNCGWLPLHEACNYGYKEIVELLVEKGANVNDRGGSGCNGMTPLHDTCSNGHLEVIEYLLDHGASVLAQNDNGETPLDILKNYREQTNLDPITQTYYETLVTRMSTILEKAGRPLQNTSKKQKTSPISHIESRRKRTPLKYENKSTKISPFSTRKSFSSPGSSISSPSSRGSSAKKINSPRGQPVGTLRHIIDNGSSDEDTPMISAKERLKNRTAEVCNSLSTLEKDRTKAKDEYKRVMESLRHRIPETKGPKASKMDKNSSAYISGEDVGDNWLEDDLNLTRPTKKRKFGNVIKQNLLETVGTRKSNSPAKISRYDSSSNLLNSFGSENEFPNVPQELEEQFIELDSSSNDSFTSANNSFKRKKMQLSLLDSGFSRTVSPEPSFGGLKRTTSSSNISKTFRRQPKIFNFTVPSEILEPDSTTNSIESIITPPTATVQPLINKVMYAISVKIESKLWRIPVPGSEIDNLTIGWLANEAAKRYYSKEGILPTLQLETRDGAILVNEDPLSIVFLSPTQPEEVQSSVLNWNLPPLPERYLEACNTLKIDVVPQLREKLDETQGTLNLNLANFALKKQIIPLFRALNRENNLQVINLTSCNLSTEGTQHLTTCLPSLSQLKNLNLSLNNISMESLRYLSDIFSGAQKPILENLIDLNLSYNPLGDESLRYLEVISKFTKLRTLNLASCNFTDRIFELNNYVNLNFGSLEILNLSYNSLDKSSIAKFVSFLNFKMIMSLNFSNNAITESGILKEISLNLQHCSSEIRNLYLARCKINDAEIWDFLRLLPSENKLETLDLSYNQDLTCVSLRRLIQHSQLPKIINLEGCDNILTKYFSESDTSSWNFDKSCIPVNNLISLKISVDYKSEKNKVEFLTRLWEQEWGNKAKIEKLFDSFVHLSVVE